MRIPMMNLGAPVTETVWHYTDQHGLLGMLRNHELWANTYLHMNDTAEVQHGQKIMQEELDAGTFEDAERDFIARHMSMALEELVKSEKFILCASTDGDSLSQWRGYGGFFAVGLDPTVPLDLLARYDMRVTPEQEQDPGFEGDVWQYVSPWRRVYYDEATQRQRARQFLNAWRGLAKDGPPPYPSRMGIPWREAFARGMHGDDGYADEIACLKNPAFADEHEVRILARIEDTQRFQETRGSRYGLTPYVRLTTGHDHQTSSSFARTDRVPLPIREIRIGPGRDGADVQLGVRAALRQFGYPNDVVISASQAPYR